MKNLRLTYKKESSVVFARVKAPWGAFSNMAGGYPLLVNGVSIPTSEALYQALRFPHLPKVQEEIIKAPNPIAAKIISRENESRPDWMRIRVDIMRWCLQVKLILHWDRFSSLLLSSEGKPIVEYSKEDDFWGAKPVGDVLEGANVLGLLLMQMREDIKEGRLTSSSVIYPLEIKDFRLLNQSIKETHE